MQALIWHGGRRVELERTSTPVAGDGVVLDVRQAGICGSDLHGYRGAPGPRRPPLVLGHEAVGTVPGRPGRYVLYPLADCASCGPCRRGERHLCDRRGLLGLDRPGVLAERVAVTEDQLVPVPKGLDDRVAVLTEALATPVSALARVGLEPGARILVAGAGALGLLAVHAAVARELDVAVLEPLARRREHALTLGARHVHADPAELGAGPIDLALDTAGVEASWLAAIRAVRPGGEVAVLGLGQAEGTMPVGELVRRGIAVRGHYAYSREDFAAALALLAERPPALEWITPLGLADGPEAFRRLVDEPESVTKVVLTMGEQR